MDQLKPILKLTRWQEFVPFTTILTWLGGLTAHRVYDATLDWRLWVMLVANLAAMAYAFMINEIEDAEDDAKDPDRVHQSPIVTGELSERTAWIAAIIILVVSGLCYALCGTIPFIIGLITLILAHLYSWRRVRLKARPLIDIISHALMLSTLLYLAPFYIYADNLGALWSITMLTFLISANGQLYNQERDFEVDQEAGLHNTASILGKTFTGYLATGTVVGSVLCLIIAIFQSIFPLWLGLIPLISAPIIFFLYRDNTTDMRGNETDDPMGLIQMQLLLVANITLMGWLIAVFIS